MQNIDLTIIVVSYNTQKMTLECIRSVIEQTKSTIYELIVYDNNSTDGSVEAIRSNFPQINLVTSPNLGFASANNAAARLARGERLLLLNPDTVILDGGIDKLFCFAAANPGYRIWGGRTLFPDGSVNPSCWRYQTLLNLCFETFGLTVLAPAVFPGQSYGSWKADTERTVDYIAGCFFMIDRELWRALNGFDPTYFMFGEEADLCLRGRKFGARPRFTPDATIVHYGGSSYPNRADLYIQTFASRVTLMNHHWTKISRLAGRMMLHILVFGRFLIYRCIRLMGVSSSEEKVSLWREVWKKRSSWIDGWTEAALQAARKQEQQ